ncbi:MULTISPECIES: hypothetical protein [unclassified Microcoleus]|uniref:hypothetical protein n=1 Tax=unclassified Microcoleus TaxID=2642155 RepID=UPI0025ED6256|nr:MULTISPECIES: hypothetical protein [unclassified Microcoleus]
MIQPPIVFDFRDKYPLYQFLGFCRNLTGTRLCAIAQEYGTAKLELHRVLGMIHPKTDTSQRLKSFATPNFRLLFKLATSADSSVPVNLKSKI